jgi:hypothetical protein
MARIDERSRREMHDSLVRVHGEQVAETLMQLLPADGWADMATKQDLAHIREVLGTRIDTLETSMLAQFKVIDERFKGIDGRFVALESTITERFKAADARIAAVESRLEGLVLREMNKQTWRLVTAMLAAIIAVAGLPQVLEHTLG